MRDKLREHSIIGISPLRCEPLTGERYELGYADPRFGTARAIASKNFFDVQRCDMTLAYMPKTMPFSKGTLCELAWAFALRKPTILVTKDKKLTKHPVVQACASWILSSLDEAVDVIIGVLED
jgi:nucleoside 2-deoxyribosyltransferase